ncbi:hypothetical protein N6H14_29725 [Paenibacillus sp. CC-CFT747]|nr:hypothetical protein N6H14_29725 [Paenibacillus sp. CC-CFT747]
MDGVVWDALDAHVTAWLEALAAGRAPKSLDKAGQAAQQQPDSCPLLRKGKQLEGRRERLLELYLSGGLDRPAYERKRLELERERETLESRLREKSRELVPAHTGWGRRLTAGSQFGEAFLSQKREG